MDETNNKVILQFPVKGNGRLINEVTLRRPKVGDQLAAEDSTENKSRVEVNLVANLSGLTPAEVSEIDLADYGEIQKVLAGFFSQKPANSGRP